MWFGQTGLNVNRFETGLSASVNGAYSNTSLLDLQKRTLAAKIIRFFIAIQKAPAASKLSFPRAKLMIAVSCSGFNTFLPSVRHSGVDCFSCWD